MEFLHRLNILPRVQVQLDGQLHIRGGDERVRNYFKRWGQWTESEAEGFAVIVPEEHQARVEAVVESQKKIVLRNLSVAKIPLRPSAVSMHLLDNGHVLVLGRPSPEAMIEMQQMGGNFDESIILGEDKLMGWIFSRCDVINQLQELLSVAPTTYSSPPAATEESGPGPSAVSPVIRHHKGDCKVNKRPGGAVNEVTPVSSAEKEAEESDQESTVVSPVITRRQRFDEKSLSMWSVLCAREFGMYAVGSCSFF